ncbi:hypothetical protein [Rhizobium phage RHph_X66]|nr:hypothetical protein [Rhizobium phage RHph_X66]
MRRRVKVGDIEVGIEVNPKPDENNWIVYRYRARTNEYLSKQKANSETSAEYLFTQVVGQEELRQKRAAADAAVAESDPVPLRGHYHDHPFFARF